MTPQEIKSQAVIQQLKHMEVDGETMQHILKQVGMDEQMLRQLMMSMPMNQVEDLMEERKELNRLTKPVVVYLV
jgi:hypothetical protein